MAPNKLVFLASVASALVGTHATGMSRGDLRGSLRNNATNINDIVYVDGKIFAEGANVENNFGCHEHAGTSIFKVCGCGVEVVAHQLSECQQSSRYDTTVGSCDCGSTECDDKLLVSGYTETFHWKATSFSVKSCKH
eukprot:TRINITY_DN1769_c0_g1_i4.p1 TRINITY_DN1769_c0_g1~~TRINITY_DN1769_c0_g1_i4.p1  ORF type:complete len:155 (+),score=11.41 TRINITY_DN1769_c0_g1_i4:57-467(+)